MFENHQLWLFLWFSWCFGVFLNLFFIRPYVLGHRKGGLIQVNVVMEIERHGFMIELLNVAIIKRSGISETRKSKNVKPMPVSDFFDIIAIF